jgi:alkylation response protein AidB-like acyl-CoA dehydrogenase
VDADRNPPVYDPATRSVTMPESFKKSYQAYLDSDFWRLDLPAELGGSGAPPSLRWSVAEMMLGSNPAVYMFMSGPGFAFHPDRQRQRGPEAARRRSIEKQLGRTMVLTEPDAGSDVGAGRTKASTTATAPGTSRASSASSPPPSTTWPTTSSTWSWPAPRAPGPAPRACRLFVVPKFHVDLETGELGERNGAFVTNVEKKMGLKVSTTCELTFGERRRPPRSAPSSATCTTASRRCSRSSSTPG